MVCKAKKFQIQKMIVTIQRNIRGLILYRWEIICSMMQKKLQTKAPTKIREANVFSISTRSPPLCRLTSKLLSIIPAIPMEMTQRIRLAMFHQKSTFPLQRR